MRRYREREWGTTEVIDGASRRVPLSPQEYDSRIREAQQRIDKNELLLKAAPELYAALLDLYHALPPSMDGMPVVGQAYDALRKASGRVKP